MEVIWVYNLAEGEGKGRKKYIFMLVQSKMNPVVIVSGTVASVMDVGPGRKEKDGVWMDYMLPAI